MTDLSSRQKGFYRRAMTAAVQLRKKHSGRDTQGARRQDEPIGDIQTVAK
jgi:hypothetical protein